MATKDFMTYTPEGGVADTPTEVTVTVSNKYYGREDRKGVLRVTAQSDPSVYKDVTVVNSGAAQQVIQVLTNTRSVPSGGGQGVFKITANSQTIYLKLYYTIGGGTTKYPVDITAYKPVLTDEYGNPSTSFITDGIFNNRGLEMKQIIAGKTGPYLITLTVDLPANSDSSYRRYTLEAAITDDFRDSKYAIITQQQQGTGAVSVDVAPETLTISADGGSDTFTITSNDDTVIS